MRPKLKADNHIKVRFWGTRGSLPYGGQLEWHTKARQLLRLATPENISDDKVIDAFLSSLQGKMMFSAGGNTPCVEIKTQKDIFIIDAGTGIRDLGNELVKVRELKQGTIHLFLTHFHWDHIHGLPFFKPMYMPGFNVKIYSFYPNAEDILTMQQNAFNFPHSFGEMKSKKEFVQLEEGMEYPVNGMIVSGIKQNHPGDSYGFKIEKGDKKLIYSTDNEYTEDMPNKRAYLKFISQADLLIYDGQYSEEEYQDRKKNWGHSSNETAIKLAIQTKAKKLLFFHHKHDMSDAGLFEFYQSAIKIKEKIFPCKDLEIGMAYDNLELDV